MKQEQKNISWITLIKPPDLLTVCSLICGYIAIYCFIYNSSILAGFLILAAAIFDRLDGKLARKMKISNLFGFHLDSLVDQVSFGVVPAIGLLMSPNKSIGVFIGFLWILATTLRLSKFNTLQISEYFIGLPSTMAAAMFGMLNILPIPGPLYYSISLVLTVLMVASFRFKKI